MTMKLNMTVVNRMFLVLAIGAFLAGCGVYREVERMVDNAGSKNECPYK